MVGEVVKEMEYLRSREQKLRDTNESTNERVKWFAFGTMGMLVGLGAWQVVYLRAYFRYAFLLERASFCACSVSDPRESIDFDANANNPTDRSISSKAIDETRYTTRLSSYLRLVFGEMKIC